MEEQYTLTQTHDDNDRRVTKSGTINRKIAKFATITLGDEIEITLQIKGSLDALKARFGTWGFGLFPDPAQIEIKLATVGTAAIAKAQAVSVPVEVDDEAEAEEEQDDAPAETTSELDDTLSALNDI